MQKILSSLADIDPLLQENIKTKDFYTNTQQQEAPKQDGDDDCVPFVLTFEKCQNYKLAIEANFETLFMKSTLRCLELSDNISNFVRMFESLLKIAQKAKYAFPGQVFNFWTVFNTKSFLNKYFERFCNRFLNFYLKHGNLDINQFWTIMTKWLAILPLKEFREFDCRLLEILLNKFPEYLKLESFFTFWFNLPKYHDFDEIRKIFTFRTLPIQPKYLGKKLSTDLQPIFSKIILPNVLCFNSEFKNSNEMIFRFYQLLFTSYPDMLEELIESLEDFYLFHFIEMDEKVIKMLNYYTFIAAKQRKSLKDSENAHKLQAKRQVKEPEFKVPTLPGTHPSAGAARVKSTQKTQDLVTQDETDPKKINFLEHPDLVIKFMKESLKQTPDIFEKFIADNLGLLQNLTHKPEIAFALNPNSYIPIKLQDLEQAKRNSTASPFFLNLLLFNLYKNSCTFYSRYEKFDCLLNDLKLMDINKFLEDHIFTILDKFISIYYEENKKYFSSEYWIWVAFF